MIQDNVRFRSVIIEFTILSYPDKKIFSWCVCRHYDFVVKLVDEYPTNNPADTTMNNYRMLVRGDIFRGRYRNSFSNPAPFTPGKVTEVKFTLPDIVHTFKKGHRMMVIVQSSWFRWLIKTRSNL